MKNTFHAGERAFKRRRVAQIAREIFEREVSNRAVIARRTQKNADVRAARNELPGDVATKKARSSRHKSLLAAHAFSS